MDYVSPMELTTLIIKTSSTIHKLSLTEHRLLLSLLSFVNKDLHNKGYCAWPSTDTLEDRSGLSTASIERARKVLVTGGWMKYKSGRGAGQTNVYHLSADKIIECAVQSGENAPKKPVAPTPETTVQKDHVRNTTGLKKGKVQPAPTAKPAPEVEPFVDKPPRGRNPDGSSPFHANGTECWSWDGHRKATSSVDYETLTECPF